LRVLEVEKLKVQTDGRIVVDNANLYVSSGEIVLLFGPNGSGKTSLTMALLGHPNYKIVDGKIFFYRHDITNLTLEERVRLGLTAAFQFSPELRGVKLYELAREIAEKHGVSKEAFDDLIKTLQLDRLLDRHVNVGFSGGERKRVEIFLAALQSPKFIIFDEPDSGVDRDSVALIAKAIEKMFEFGLKGALIITHTGFLTRYLRASRAYVMINKRIVCEGPAEIVSDHIIRFGFDPCEARSSR